MEAPWNSLEVTKLVVGVLTPVVIAWIGLRIQRMMKRFEHAQWRSQKLIEKRLKTYEVLGSDFNDLLCYFTYVGKWRDVDPDALIKKKRDIDREVYLAAPLFSGEFFEACMAFQSICFSTYNGWGLDARLRTKFERRKASRPHDWRPEWEPLYCDEASALADVRAAYDRVMRAFATDIGVHDSFVIPPTGKSPQNIR